MFYEASVELNVHGRQFTEHRGKREMPKCNSPSARKSRETDSEESDEKHGVLVSATPGVNLRTLHSCN